MPQCIVDVGASNGLWTRECMTVFPNSQYFLVDPLWENLASLETLAAERRNVSFWSGSLGAANGTSLIHVHGDQSSFLASEFARLSAHSRQVEMRTLDSFLGSELAIAPSMIKADVQGYELDVLKGATRCLETVEVLLLEVSYRRIYDGCPLAHEVISFVGELGFRVYDICTYAQRPRDNELCQSDILFAREGSRLFSFEGWQ